jgi:hypothetical protein
MTDSKRSFLQVSMSFPNPVDGEAPIRIMIFGNPALRGMLKTPGLDVFVDATFDSAPHPFSECLIFMIYDHSTSNYVPILYILMTSKCMEAYWHAFNQIVAISEWQIRVRTYCTDFEIAMMKQMDTPSVWNKICKYAVQTCVGNIWYFRNAYVSYSVRAKCGTMQRR